MYQVTTSSKVTAFKPIVKQFKTFRTAHKWYNDFCLFSLGKIETEIEDGTILGWSENKYTKIEFEKLTSINAKP